MRFVIAIMVAICITAPQIGLAVDSGTTLERIKQSGTVRIGYRENEPPMSFVGEDKNPVGYSIDLCTRIVSEIRNTLDNPDIKIEFVPVTASSRFDAVANNEIDILCGATTKTLSRSEKVDFTQMTFVTGASLLILEGGDAGGFSGLQGKSIAVVENTTTKDHLENALKEALIDANVVTVNSAAKGMKALILEDVDAFASDQVVLIGLVLMHNGPEKFSISQDVFSYEPFALAVQKNDSEFRLVADRALSRLSRSGQITNIYKKWFGKFSDEVPGLLAALYLLNSTPE